MDRVYELTTGGGAGLIIGRAYKRQLTVHIYIYLLQDRAPCEIIYSVIVYRFQ